MDGLRQVGKLLMNIMRVFLRQLSRGNNYFDVLWCAVRYGASPNNYYDFEFNNLSAVQRKSYVTNRFSRKMIKRFNDPRFIHIFEDRSVYASYFSDFYGRKWISTHELTIDKLKDFINQTGGDTLIYKPVNNAQGKDIHVLDKVNDINSLFCTISGLNHNAIIEEWIQQHPVLSQVYPEAVNCLRIITVYINNKIYYLAGGITWGNGKKIANASASGFVSPVNFETGILEKPGADFYGHIFETHPLTGTSIVGLQLPYWKETLKMIEKAAKIVPQVGYVGWDIAITPNGPIIIEGNTTPGYKYYQIPIHMEDKKGNKDNYLKAYNASFLI